MALRSKTQTSFSVFIHILTGNLPIHRFLAPRHTQKKQKRSSIWVCAAHMKADVWIKTIVLLAKRFNCVCDAVTKAWHFSHSLIGYGFPVPISSAQLCADCWAFKMDFYFRINSADWPVCASLIETKKKNIHECKQQTFDGCRYTWTWSRMCNLADGFA